jgi:hypothetical protein
MNLNQDPDTLCCLTVSFAAFGPGDKPSLSVVQALPFLNLCTVNFLVCEDLLDKMHLQGNRSLHPGVIIDFHESGFSFIVVSCRCQDKLRFAEELRGSACRLERRKVLSHQILVLEREMHAGSFDSRQISSYFAIHTNCKGCGGLLGAWLLEPDAFFPKPEPQAAPPRYGPCEF